MHSFIAVDYYKTKIESWINYEEPEAILSTE